MSKRVATLAALLGFVFVLVFVLYSAFTLTATRNMTWELELSQLCRVSAAAMEAHDNDSEIVSSLVVEPNLTVHWHSSLEEAEAEEELLALNPRIAEDYAQVPAREEKGFTHENAAGARTLYAIYRFDDGAFLQLSRTACTPFTIFDERGVTYLALLIGVTIIIFAVAKIVEYRKQRLIDQIMDTLEAFSEGKFETRIAQFKGDSPKQIAEYNAVIARIEERIFRQRSRNQALSVVINQMQNGILAVNDKMRVILVTPVAKQLLGLTGSIEDAELEGLSKDVNLAPIYAKAMQQGGVYTEDIAVRAKLGRGHTPLRLYISPMKQDGQVIGALAMVEDITELRRLEQMRTDFAANVSHELKTPLTSIKGFVETLMDGAINQPEMAQKFLKIIMMETERLTRLINDILSISKLESGAATVDVQRLRLDQMAYDVADMLEIHASEKKVTINARLNSRPVYVMGNADRVEQMLINLVENAIKYNKEGGTVTVQVFADENQASLTVSDTGIGIPEEHLPRLFERFYRVDKGRSRSMGGTGLGLAIVKHIVNSMKGSIEVHSKFGEGTEFLVSLPLAPEQPEEPEITAEE